MESKKAKIVHILSSLNPGGISTFIKNLIQADKAQEYQHELVLIITAGLMTEELEKSGFKIHKCFILPQIKIAFSYRIERFLRKILSVFFVFRLAFLIKRLTPDIVQSHAHATHWMEQILATRFAKAAFLMTLHSPSSPFPLTKKALHFFIPLLKASDRIVAVGKNNYEAYQTFFDRIPQNIAYPMQGIPNGIRDEGKADPSIGKKIRESLHIPENALIIGSSGRLIHQKRFQDLLMAINSLKTKHIEQDIYILLIGDGSYSEELKKRSTAYALQDTVRFPGYQTNPMEWINAMDIFVNISEYEGFGIAVVEAMSKGLAIIGSDVRGTQDLIQNMENGLLVPLNNIEKLQAALLMLINKKELREKLGMQARKDFMDKYNINNSVTKYCSLYEEMLNIKNQ
jgi:glycosyltransferase involved in cell wall biosynthesis